MTTLNKAYESIKKPGTPIDRITFFVGGVAINAVSFFLNKIPAISESRIFALILVVLVLVANAILAYNRFLDLKPKNTSIKLLIGMIFAEILTFFLAIYIGATGNKSLLILLVLIVVIDIAFYIYLQFFPGKLSRVSVSKIE